MHIGGHWFAAALAVALASGGQAAAQSKAPDFSALATTPGTEADRANHPGAAAGPVGPAGHKRGLHLEGLGVGYDVNDRLTIKGGFRGGLGEDGAAAAGPSGSFFLGIRRSLGRR